MHYYAKKATGVVRYFSMVLMVHEEMAIRLVPSIMDIPLQI